MVNINSCYHLKYFFKYLNFKGTTLRYFPITQGSIFDKVFPFTPGVTLLSLDPDTTEYTDSTMGINRRLKFIQNLKWQQTGGIDKQRKN